VRNRRSDVRWIGLPPGADRESEGRLGLGPKKEPLLRISCLAFLGEPFRGTGLKGRAASVSEKFRLTSEPQKLADDHGGHPE
jgi:hypothetical protein